MGPAADPSKWEYNLFNSDLNFFDAPLFGSTTAAWKLTGRPYLNNKLNTISSCVNTYENYFYIIQYWSSEDNIPENRFDEYSKCLEMNVSCEDFTEVYLEPSDERSVLKGNTNIGHYKS